jgi:hypothetical protein
LDIYGGGGGGIKIDSSSPTIVDCVISKNMATGGGSAIDTTGVSRSRLMNCTIVDDHYNAVILNSSFPSMVNCIVRNSILDYQLIASGSPAVQYSNIQGGFPGTGNIDSDPLFVDPANGDFHLQANSPCIGKGIGPTLNSLVPLFDFEGDPRSGQECDMGADEFVGATRVWGWENY